MADRQYVCAYPYCLHHGEKVSGSEAVVIGKKHYHWDCASLKQEIQECAQLYIEYMGDKTQYPIALKIINTMVFKNSVPIEFIRRKIDSSRVYYSGKPVYALYGIRNLYWEFERKS